MTMKLPLSCSAAVGALVILMFMPMFVETASAQVMTPANDSLAVGATGYIARQDSAHNDYADHVRATRVMHQSLSVDIRDRFARKAVAEIRSRDAGNIDILASGTFLSPNWILTAAHPFISKARLNALKASVGRVLPTIPTDVASLNSLAICDFHFVLDQLVSSVRGYLDYLLVKVTPVQSKACSKSTTQADSGSAFEAPFEIPSAQQLRGKPAYAMGFTSNSEYPDGLSLLHGGVFLGARRYTKNLGTLFNLDYETHATPGFSGGPIFDEAGRWIAIHQRSTERALDDDVTRWNPYLDEYYPYQYDPKKSVWRRPPEPMPSQGTPLTDIAFDVVNKCGIRWMCANVPALAAILPHGDEYACKGSGASLDLSVSSESLACGAEENRYRPPDVGSGDVN